MKPLYKKLFVFLSIVLIILSNLSFVSADYNLEYDNNGNLVRDDKFSYEYDGFNQLVKIKENNNLIAEYFYDHNGERIKKAEYSGRAREPVSITYYVGDFVRTVKGNKVEDSIYYYNDGQLVAKEENNKKYYYHPDYLGSTNLITDENGNLFSEMSYLPFGKSLAENNERFTFTGQESDKESDLMYYGARYYNPSSGRFIQPDEVIQDIYNPQNLNRYSYVLNNPYKYNDPSGNYVESIIDITFITLDINDIKGNPYNAWNWASLSLDVGAIALPFITGGRLLVKGLEKSVDVAKVSEKAGDIGVAMKDVREFKISELYASHPIDNPSSLFKESKFKTHTDIKDPLEVIEVQGKNIVAHGHGRTVRNIAQGKDTVLGRYIYQSSDYVGKASKNVQRLEQRWLDRASQYGKFQVNEIKSMYRRFIGK